MKAELEANTLPEAVRLTIFVRNKNYREVGKELDIAYSRIWRIAKGNIAGANINTLVKLFDFLQVTEVEFIQLLRNTVDKK